MSWTVYYIMWFSIWYLKISLDALQFLYCDTQIHIELSCLYFLWLLLKSLGNKDSSGV